MKVKSLATVLGEVLKTYGGTKYKSVPLDTLKESICDSLGDVSTHSPAEQAMITKLRSSIMKKKDAESVFTLITEKMFALSN